MRSYCCVTFAQVLSNTAASYPSDRSASAGILTTRAISLCYVATTQPQGVFTTTTLPTLTGHAAPASETLKKPGEVMAQMRIFYSSTQTADTHSCYFWSFLVQPAWQLAACLRTPPAETFLLNCSGILNKGGFIDIDRTILQCCIYLFIPDEISDFAMYVIGLFFFPLIFNTAHLTAVLKHRPKACSLGAYLQIIHMRK